MLKKLAAFQVACVSPGHTHVYLSCLNVYNITQKFSAKNVYFNFHLTLLTKAVDNLDHKISIEISM